MTKANMEFSELDKKFMQIAIDEAKAGTRLGNKPFGTCIVKDGKILYSSHNHVASSKDITAHAESYTIRECCLKLDTFSLKDCTLYTTCEPCIMCLGSIFWSQIEKVFYGIDIKSMQELGFRQFPLSAEKMVRDAGVSIEVIGGLLLKENKDLMMEWKRTFN